MKKEDLMRMALEASANAYARHIQSLKVGAALLAKSGRVYKG